MDKRTLLFTLCCTLTFLAIHTWYTPSPVATPSPREVLASTPPTEPLFVAAQELVPLSPVETQETFYVLENNYQQLVFSSKGGSLAEINLPFRENRESKSVVREIDIDREILSHSPNNARFPLFPYQTPQGTTEREGSLGGYYPLLRRPLFDLQGKQISQIDPSQYAFAIEGSQISSYKMTSFTNNGIEFRGSDGKRTITKTFAFSPEAPYCIDLTIRVEGDATGLWISSGVPDVEIVADSYTPLLRYQVEQKGGNEVETLSLPKKGPEESSLVRPNWISNSNGFFALLIDPMGNLPPGYRAKQIPGTEMPTRLSVTDPGYHPYPAADYPGYTTALPLQSGKPLSFRLFAGPLDGKILDAIDALYTDPKTGYSPEYASAQKIQGWFSFISEPFTKLLSFLLTIFHFLTRSWAAAIVLLTVALRAMMYPLNSWSFRSMAKMQKLAPQRKALEEKFKKDPYKAKLETAKLYKEQGFNPLSGCIPMLLQIPFLSGMFYLLKSFFPLRGAPFIPGWIDDLSAPDILFSWQQPLWFIGNEFHLLPILMGAGMFLQTKFSQAKQNVADLSDLEKQQRQMTVLLPLILTVLFYNVPSGLNIYFLFSTLLGVAQQSWVNRKMG